MPPLSPLPPPLSCSIFHFIFSIFFFCLASHHPRALHSPPYTSHFRYSPLSFLSPIFCVALRSGFLRSPSFNLFHNLNDHPVNSGVILTSRITVTTNRSSGADVCSVGCHRNVWSAFRSPIHPASSTAVVRFGAFNEYDPRKTLTVPFVNYYVVSIPRLFDDHFNPASLALLFGHSCQPPVERVRLSYLYLHTDRIRPNRVTRIHSGR